MMLPRSYQILFGLLFGAGLALADTMPIVDTVYGSGNGSAGIPQFDPTLGTLEALDFEVTGQFTGNITVSNPTSSVAIWQVILRFSLTSDTGYSQILYSHFDDTSAVAPNSTEVFPYLGYPVGAIVSPVNLQPYIGSGIWHITDSTWSNGYDWNVSPGLAPPGGTPTTPLSVTANYSYIPAPTPEPRTYALLIGVGVLTLLYIRQKLNRTTPT